jgi:microcystin-dependent protein
MYNVSISLSPESAKSIASIQYVNNEVAPLNDDTAQITKSLDELEKTRATLQANIDALQTRVDFLTIKNARIIGNIISMPKIAPPTHYLFCDGSLVSTTTYATLFAKIGYAYGGSGTTFSVPNFVGRYVIGGNANLNAVAISNIATGNNYTGASNTYDNYGTGFIVPPFPVMQNAPSHSHTITEPNGGKGHQHPTLVLLGCATGLSEYEERKKADAGTAGVKTNYSATGVTIKTSGQAIDPVSGIAGVNVTPPFIAQNWFICYE